MKENIFLKKNETIINARECERVKPPSYNFFWKLTLYHPLKAHTLLKIAVPSNDIKTLSKYLENYVTQI